MQGMPYCYKFFKQVESFIKKYLGTSTKAAYISHQVPVCFKQGTIQSLSQQFMAFVTIAKEFDAMVVNKEFR